jgi:hypothetical protein
MAVNDIRDECWKAIRIGYPSGGLKLEKTMAF